MSARDLFRGVTVAPRLHQILTRPFAGAPPWRPFNPAGIWDVAPGSTATAGGSSSPDVLWMSLHQLLRRHAGHAQGAMLQQAAINAVLAAERRMKLPLWLTSMAEVGKGCVWGGD